jgi:hypothetical protein
VEYKIGNENFARGLGSKFSGQVRASVDEEVPVPQPQRSWSICITVSLSV